MPAEDIKEMFGLNSPGKKDRGLLEKEYAQHFDTWKADPNPVNATQLLKAVDPIITSAMRTFAGQGTPSPTLRSRAKLLVLDALPRYDPNKAKLRTHLMVNLQALHRAAAEEDRIISVPERVRLDQFKLHQASTELADRLGREPADSELSSHTGLSLKRLEHIRKAHRSVSEGQTSVLDEEGEEQRLQPAVVSPKQQDVWLRFIYHDLPPKDQFIMEHVLGLHGRERLPKSLIAKKLGLSPGAVSQRAARIQAIIDSKDELGLQVL